MSFQTLSELDSSKLFFIQKKDIEERLDPLFYVAVQNIKNNIIKKAKYRCDDLIKSCSINRGRFGHRPRNDPRFYNGEYPFLQTGDIVKASSDNSSIEYTQTLNEKGLKTSKLFQPPKLLFTIAANIGDTAILDYPSCFPDSVVAIIPNNDDITLEYLNYYLRLIKHYVVELAPYSAQRNLNNQQLAQVPIVIPPKDIQDKIVDIMDSAYDRKKQKDEEALELLDNIKHYLLGELGIKLPEQEENTIQRRIFTRQLSEVSGGRFDPFFSSLNKQDKSGTYKFYKLKELADVRKGNSITSDDILDGDIPVIAGGQTSPYSHNVANSEGDVITISASGAYSGYVWYHEDCIFASDCTMISSKDTDELSNKYIFEYLKTEQQDIYNLQQGSGQPHVYPSDLEKIKIPIPPIEKQTKITDHITNIRNQAKQLQQQAKEELEQAKKEVEAMILGEDAKKA
jgi:restriction endonuclease S subunit